MSNVVHVHPVADQVEHDTQTAEPTCVCGPSMQPVKAEDGSMGWVMVHHSLDGREQGEVQP